MENLGLHIPDLDNEFVFQTSRSSGPGGQNVNKVNSRVELRFDISNSVLLKNEQKQLLLRKLASKVTSEGILTVVSQETRSQLGNKELAVKKFYNLLSGALKPVKKRKATRPTKASEEKRLQKKRETGEKKAQRGRVDYRI
ncbi:MAG: alternative ribosome rescue aminoacyl-tRNA hydrolase ArfB [Mangrovibacterium sp.]